MKQTIPALDVCLFDIKRASVGFIPSKNACFEVVVHNKNAARNSRAAEHAKGPHMRGGG